MVRVGMSSILRGCFVALKFVFPSKYSSISSRAKKYVVIKKIRYIKHLIIWNFSMCKNIMLAFRRHTTTVIILFWILVEILHETICNWQEITLMLFKLASSIFLGTFRNRPFNWWVWVWILLEEKLQYTLHFSLQPRHLFDLLLLLLFPARKRPCWLCLDWW